MDNGELYVVAGISILENGIFYTTPDIDYYNDKLQSWQYRASLLFAR